MNDVFRARCFGLTWQSDFDLDQFDSDANSSGAADIVVERVASLPPRDTVMASRNAGFDAQGFRFRWWDQAVFDMVDGDRIACCPGPAWPGVMPHSFYGTVTALTCAWRGMVALHASSVILHDRAWLIGGPAGAGKSTLTAELLGAGATLLADDLTMLRPAAGPLPDYAVRGRPALRLHPATAATVAGGALRPIPDDPRGKVLATPHARAEDRLWPIGGMLIVGTADSRALTGPEVAATLGAIRFRPRLSEFLPRQPERRLALLQAAGGLPGWRMRPVSGFDTAARAYRIATALDIINRMAGAKPAGA